MKLLVPGVAMACAAFALASEGLCQQQNQQAPSLNVATQPLPVPTCDHPNCKVQPGGMCSPFL